MFSTPPSGEETGLAFADAFVKETDSLREARKKRGVPVPTERPLEQDFVGLAFSGGGIRSATFNLGVIQALASRHLLSLVDYLSTVSGGGYIGSWLSSWAYYVGLRSVAGSNHIAQIEDELNQRPKDVGDIAERHEVHFLRKYSNYLTPRLGALTGDTLAFVGTYVRNLVLNQIILISALLSLLLLPRTLGLMLVQFSPSTSAWISAGAALILLTLVVVGVALNTREIRVDPHSFFAKYYTPAGVIFCVAIPQFLSCVFASYALWHLVTTQNAARCWLLPRNWLSGLWVCGSSAVVYGILWFAAIGVGLLRKPHSQAAKPASLYLVWAPALWSLPAGAFAGVLLLWVSHELARWPACNPSSPWYVLTFHVPLIALSGLLVGTLHLGFIGRAYEDRLREWWARLGGVLAAIVLFWFAVCVLTLFFPLSIECLYRRLTDGSGVRLWKILSSLGITGVITSWITLTLKGLFVAKGNTIGPRPPSNDRHDFLARMAPPVFVLGLVAMLSLGLSWLVPLAAGTKVGGTYWDVLSGSCLARVLLLLGSLLAISRFFGWRVDVNEFSLHNAYRNRLVRCYLGATHRDRKPQPFTGFDQTDNIYMHDLQGLGAPFHIVNATLNVVKGKELALQSRKARSFTFTPLYSGFDYTVDEATAKMPGATGYEGPKTTTDPEVHKSGSYRLTKNCSWNSRYPGARLGTAMAISGAAASPNMGHYTSGAVSFLLTIFTVRLGWWLGNPLRKKSWESGSPRSSWRALMNELTGTTNEDQNEIYLSDGGHFENLAMYELVRRRCRVIIACDAGADPAFSCDDLAAAIEKCRVDFQTYIDIDLDEVRPCQALFPGDQKIRSSETPFAQGTIRYPDGRQGKLIYIKPSLNADLPQDVLAYARLAEAFPHQSTIDQFFDESQFESYRALGFACATSAIDEIATAIRS